MAPACLRGIRKCLQQRTLLFLVMALWLSLFVINRARRSRYPAPARPDYADDLDYDDGNSETGGPAKDHADYRYMLDYQYEYGDHSAKPASSKGSNPKDVAHLKGALAPTIKTTTVEKTVPASIKMKRVQPQHPMSAVKPAAVAGNPESPPVKPPTRSPPPPRKAGEYDGRYEVPKPQVFLNISEDPEFEKNLDFFKTAPIPFLPNYKNPCWFEYATNPDEYFKNFFLLATDRNLRFLESYRQMKSILESREGSQGQPPWRLRCLPAYYIAGFSKCGSTDLSLALDLHPEIIKGDMKELKYWNRVRHPHNIQRYQIAQENHPHLNKFPRRINHFLESLDYSAEKCRSHKLPALDVNEPPYHPMLIGDSTPSYTWDFDSWHHMELNKGLDEPKYIAAHYIRHVTPQAKIVIIVRNPTDRLYSDFKGFQRHKEKTKEYFHELAQRGIQVFNECLIKRSLRACMYDFDVNNRENVLPVRVRVGIYQPILKDWLSVFPKEQVFITRLDEYATHRREIVSGVVKFLGLREMPEERYTKLEEAGIRNQATRRMNDRLGGDMLNATRKMLDDFYRPYNEQLATFMKDDNYKWMP